MKMIKITKSLIDKNCKIFDGACIHNSVITGNTVISGKCYITNCNIPNNVIISGKIGILNLKFSEKIYLYSSSDEKIWINNKKQLKDFIKAQDKIYHKNLNQIMIEELSIYECEEI